jgi:HD-GYP domain-containing protein (c-di-GMP phosphodiesterase class II)
VGHPQRPEQELLRANFTLDVDIIKRMREMGVEFIYVLYPSLDQLDEHLKVFLSPARQQILKQIRQAVAGSQKSTRPTVSFNDYCSATQSLIDTLMTQGQNPIYLDMMSRQGSDGVQHAAAVAHLALLLGLRLEQYLIAQRSRLPGHRAKDCVSLGVAGMLHDIGLTKMNPAYSKYSDVDPPTDEAQLAEWKTHCEVGYEMIRNDIPGTTAACVLQHHQHFDKSGFPELRAGLLDGERIHVFARILAAANIYDRLSRPSTGAARRSNLQVYTLMHEKFNGWIDPEIYRVLRDVAPVIPPGERVMLSDNTRAIVVEANVRNPGQAIVQKLMADNWTPDGKPIDLSKPGMPKIAEPGLEKLSLAA